MDSNETDVTPSEDGHNPPSKQGDSIDWAAVTPYRRRTPPGYDDDWTLSSISRRFAHGTRAETTIESPTGETVTLSEPHWDVTIKRDQFPQVKSPTAEYEHYVFPDASALVAWFGDDAEILE
jgi:hypothetical protein